jgi:hypothetical protein
MKGARPVFNRRLVVAIVKSGLALLSLLFERLNELVSGLALKVLRIHFKALSEVKGGLLVLAQSVKRLATKMQSLDVPWVLLENLCGFAYAPIVVTRVVEGLGPRPYQIWRDFDVA